MLEFLSYYPISTFPLPPSEVSYIDDNSSYIAAMIGLGETIHAIRESR
jgi:hypothetical protein